jgi:hypothetical protein
MRLKNKLRLPLSNPVCFCWEGPFFKNLFKLKKKGGAGYVWGGFFSSEGFQSACPKLGSTGGGFFYYHRFLSPYLLSKFSFHPLLLLEKSSLPSPPLFFLSQKKACPQVVLPPPSHPLGGKGGGWIGWLEGTWPIKFPQTPHSPLTHLAARAQDVGPPPPHDSLHFPPI